MSPITIAAERSGYTRAHVRGIAYRHRKRLGLRKRKGKWEATAAQIRALISLVRSESGLRCKLGETGVG